MPSTRSTCACRPRAGCSRRSRFRREALSGAASDEMIAATDVADLLVRRGIPFRQSHGIVAGLVRDGGRVRSRRSPSSTAEDLARHSDALDDEFYAVLSAALVAGEQGLRGRDGAGPRARAAGARARGARWPARLAADATLRPRSRGRSSRSPATCSAASCATARRRA